jgi:hypothetical protein
MSWIRNLAVEMPKECITEQLKAMTHQMIIIDWIGSIERTLNIN